MQTSPKKIERSMHASAATILQVHALSCVLSSLEIAPHPPVYILLPAQHFRASRHFVPYLLPVLRLDKVAEVLGLLVSVVVVAVVIVSVVRRADVLHLVDVAALGATLNGAVLGDLVAS